MGLLYLYCYIIIKPTVIPKKVGSA